MAPRRRAERRRPDGTLLSGILAYFVSGRALKPLRSFASQVEQVQLNNLADMRIDEDAISEFRQLSRSFNQMLERLNNAFTAQRQFAGNAAHELRTPLALKMCIRDSTCTARIGALAAVLRRHIELVGTEARQIEMCIRDRCERIDAGELQPRHEHFARDKPNAEMCIRDSCRTLPICQGA